MLKKTFAAVLIITLMAALMAGAEPIQSDHPVKEDFGSEIIRVVKGAVEDTCWLHASSRQEMEHLLSAYYTGNLLDELSDSGWRFVSLPNSWEYSIRMGRVDVELISEQEGTAYAEVLEEDEISGCTYSSILKYSLINNSYGWKIRAKTVCIP